MLVLSIYNLFSLQNLTATKDSILFIGLWTLGKFCIVHCSIPYLPAYFYYNFTCASLKNAI